MSFISLLTAHLKYILITIHTYKRAIYKLSHLQINLSANNILIYVIVSGSRSFNFLLESLYHGATATSPNQREKRHSKVVVKVMIFKGANITYNDYHINDSWDWRSLVRSVGFAAKPLGEPKS